MQLEITRRFESAFAGIVNLCESVRPKEPTNNTVVTGALFNLSAEEAAAYNEHRSRVVSNYQRDIGPIRREVKRRHLEMFVSQMISELGTLLPNTMGEIARETASERRDDYAVKSIEPGLTKLLLIIFHQVHRMDVCDKNCPIRQAKKRVPPNEDSIGG